MKKLFLSALVFFSVLSLASCSGVKENRLTSAMKVNPSQETSQKVLTGQSKSEPALTDLTTSATSSKAVQDLTTEELVDEAVHTTKNVAKLNDANVEDLTDAQSKIIQQARVITAIADDNKQLTTDLGKAKTKVTELTKKVNKPTKFVMAGYESNLKGDDKKVTAEVGSTLGHLIGSVGVGVPLDTVVTGQGITDINNYTFTLKGGVNW